MKFAVSASGKATRIVKIIKFLQEVKPELLEKISFVFVDNLDCDELRSVCEESGVKLIEVDDGDLSAWLLLFLKERMVGYLFLFSVWLLEREILKDYKGRIINFHPSLLPDYKGLNAIDRALEDGAEILGNTAHVVDDTIDGGLIVMRSMLKISEYQDYDDVLDMQIPMFIQLMEWICDGRFVIDEKKAIIRGADYEEGAYVPRLELDYLKNL